MVAEAAGHKPDAHHKQLFGGQMAGYFSPPLQELGGLKPIL